MFLAVVSTLLCALHAYHVQHLAWGIVCEVGSTADAMMLQFRVCVCSLRVGLPTVPFQQVIRWLS